MRGAQTLARVETLGRGYDSHATPLKQPKGTTPACENVVFDNDIVSRRPAYTALGSALTGGVAHMAQWEKLDGTQYPIAVTVDKIYHYSSGWQNVTGTDLTGDLDDSYTSCNWLGTQFIFTNGKDGVRKWTGAGNTADLGGGSDYQSVQTVHKAKVVLTWKNRVHFFNTIEDSTACEQRHRYSENADSEGWDSDLTAGFVDVFEGGPQAITGAIEIRDSIAIFKADAIVLCSYVGAEAFAYEAYSTTVGCEAPNTIRGHEQFCFFMGPDNVYAFDGQSLKGIGQPLQREVFEGVGRTYRNLAHAVVWPDKHWYVLFVPFGDSGITKAYVYDYVYDRWTRWGANTASAAGIYAIGTAMTWTNLASYTWDQLQQFQWADFHGQAGAQHLAIGYESGSVDELLPAPLDDNGTPIQQYYDSPVLFGTEEYVRNYKRWLQLDFEARGAGIATHYSIDYGETWKPIANTSLTANWARYSVPLDVTSRTIRFRFQYQDSAKGFELRWYEPRGLVRGER